MENFIQLKKDTILRIGIKDAEGNDTGNHLEFDLEDVTLALRLTECEEKHKMNQLNARNKLNILDKKQDKKGKKLLSYKQEEQVKIINEFYNEEIKAMDLFLGEGGTEKLLNGRKPYFSMYDDIAEIIEPIMPLIKERTISIKDKIIQKYGKEATDILKIEDDENESN